MAGSLNHVTTAKGNFTFELIDNLGDAHEACEEIFDIIAYLVGYDLDKLARACLAGGYGLPKACPKLGAREDG